MRTAGPSAVLEVALPCALATALAATGCAAGLPRPAEAPQPAEAFVDVPYPPPAARVETLPPRPDGRGVWIDGQWTWDGARWSWTPGGWVDPAPGGRFARWALRLEHDGRFRFAHASWRDASGHELPPAHILAPAVGAAPSLTLPARCE
jgi:hypothetical protein